MSPSYVGDGTLLHDSLAFEPAKRPDDRADYCLDCSFLLQCKYQVLVCVEWKAQLSIPRTLGQLAGPIKFLA